MNGLTPDDREKRTPCDKWNVHELIEHMCQGGQMIAGGLQDQAPPEEMPDFLADGPAERMEQRRRSAGRGRHTRRARRHPPDAVR